MYVYVFSCICTQVTSEYACVHAGVHVCKCAFLHIYVYVEVRTSVFVCECVCIGECVGE